jgi:CRP-like cAMP-binding protein
MTSAADGPFSVATFLANAGLGRRIITLMPKDVFFSQGDLADSIFYLQKGRAKLTVVSAAGKEASITFLGPGDFVGEEALAAMSLQRLATASRSRSIGKTWSASCTRSMTSQICF